MAYTNIASPYSTAGDPNANFNFNRHSWTRFNQDHPAHSKAQFKVALQQLQEAGVLDPARGYANEKLRTEILQGTPGMYSPRNPLGKYQGIHGNFGLIPYNAAKADGWSPQDIFTEIQGGRSGMFMPEGSMAQYREDMAVATPTPTPPQLPGTQTGQANVGARYNALGIRTPSPAGHDLNTGGTKKAFGRDRKNRDLAAAQLAINPLTL